MRLIPSECTRTASAAPTLKQAPRKSSATERDQKIIKNTCFKMMQYSSSNGNLTIEELNTLNLDLERSILAVQRRKKKLIEKKSKRRV
jgi:hypothetical protein